MSITESLGELYDTKKFSDIFFSFPNEPDFERIPAHKLMLSIRSPVFEAMFYGDLAETAPENFVTFNIYFQKYSCLVKERPLPA
ncbi:hypothetical protein KUTeg_000448 [Tegillarca granosa]|uniref:BTB domain-containing protein n=1 Tax=Tegillarca granosa TaxID=220873 RepID=A0ABQ9FYM5_TEGGR|nr:hypothetical protein KUTeg_000448 [Tegillarca granosa]